MNSYKGWYLVVDYSILTTFWSPQFTLLWPNYLNYPNMHGGDLYDSILLHHTLINRTCTIYIHPYPSPHSSQSNPWWPILVYCYHGSSSSLLFFLMLWSKLKPPMLFTKTLNILSSQLHQTIHTELLITSNLPRTGWMVFSFTIFPFIWKNIYARTNFYFYFFFLQSLSHPSHVLCCFFLGTVLHMELANGFLWIYRSQWWVIFCLM